MMAAVRNGDIIIPTELASLAGVMPNTEWQEDGDRSNSVPGDQYLPSNGLYLRYD